MIYKITNVKLNKIYVGQTNKSLIHRVFTHKNRYQNKKEQSMLYSDMHKYGLQCFTIQVLRKIPNKTLDEQEIYYIKKLNCLEPNGYNRTIGGKNFSNLARENTKGKGSITCEKLKIGAFYDPILRNKILKNAQKIALKVKVLKAQELLDKHNLEETEINYINITKKYRKYDNEFLTWKKYLEIKNSLSTTI